MSLSFPSPSNRLLRAAAAEQADLARHRERLTRERDKRVIELRRVDEALAAIEERLAALAQLTGAPEPDASAHGSQAPKTQASVTLESGQPGGNRQVLRGPAIREVAVHVLIAQPGHIEALHYRRWYELVREAGYAVAGKEPLAVFLTQVSRSPIISKASEPGVYEVDRQAHLRIRRRLDRLQVELREVTVAPQPPIELATVRARRHELDLAISQQERALEEALRVLQRQPGEASRTLASAR